ncbi:MAG: hypothetical protein ACREYF_01595 [Gammaproteobacteria bacterium]
MAKYYDSILLERPRYIEGVDESVIEDNRSGDARRCRPPFSL